MRRLLLALLALGCAAVPAGARTPQQNCRFERGVLIAPAEVMGVAGDFIIDTGQAQTLLAETQAQEAGFKDVALTGVVRLAGLSLSNRPVTVMDLDSRTVFLATPIAGVIGVDVLRGRVMDVSFAPCRLALHPPDEVPNFPARRRAEMGWESGLPVVHAEVSDGVSSWPASFTPATGLEVSLRLDDRLAGAPGAGRPNELYPGGVWRAALSSLTFAGDVYRDVDTGLMKGPAEGPAPAGLIGGQVLSRYRLRFDFPGGWLYIAEPR